MISIDDMRENDFFVRLFERFDEWDKLDELIEDEYFNRK